MCIGWDVSGSNRRPISLTQLRRNKRKKADKTCGRKRPRVADTDVIAANDADSDIAVALQQDIVVNNDNGLQDEVVVPCQCQPAVESVVAATDRPTPRGTAADNCAECGRQDPLCLLYTSDAADE